jgi:hypothetical protein
VQYDCNEGLALNVICVEERTFCLPVDEVREVPERGHVACSRRPIVSIVLFLQHR